MGLNALSDYGSGSSMNSDLDTWQPPKVLAVERPLQKATSIADCFMMGRCTIEDVMKEFRMNGFDAPYSDGDQLWSPAAPSVTDSSLAPSGVGYLRQKSWPAPEQTPAPRLPRPATWFQDTNADYTNFSMNVTSTSTPITDLIPSSVAQPTPPEIFPQPDALTIEQKRVLETLPTDTIYILLKEIEKSRGNVVKRAKIKPDQECRFCKNNNERDAYVRSHATKDARGRVTCPVLRAFVCRRCGASGDHAHTAKYCPLTTNEERLKSTAMMRSVRLGMASGKRRYSYCDADYGYNSFAAPRDTAPHAQVAPLDPLWAALAQKLML